MVFRKFTQTYDINTEKDSPTLLGIHTPIGGDAWRFLYPFFQAYKKFKYVGCDITIVNAARLPVDPEQVGKIAGTNYVDPRDTLNPILFKGCHGESLGHVLNSMYGGLTSDIFKGTGVDKEVMDATLENFYYTALGDDAWRKSPVQKTLSIKGLHPLVYQLAFQHQILPTNALEHADYAENNYTEFPGSSAQAPAKPQSGALGGLSNSAPPAVGNTHLYDPSTGSYVNKQIGSIFTNKMTSIGWLDTMTFIGNINEGEPFNQYRITELPKQFMGILCLPPAYLTRQYLRVIITHKFKFAGYRTITTGGAGPGYDPRVTPIGYFNGITGNVDPGNTKVPDGIDRGPGAVMTASGDVEIMEEEDDDD